MTQAEARGDFLKRFFAVAVSVGFASQLHDIGFLVGPESPNFSQLSQLLLLCLGIFITVGSWDFYFKSIKGKPLVDWQRFYLDIFIVTLYILLLSSSKNIVKFSWYIVAIMGCYLVWDWLSMRAYPERYRLKDARWQTIFRSTLLSVFENELSSARVLALAPFISAWWLGIVIYISFHIHDAPASFVWFWFFVSMSFLFYRIDQIVHLNLLKRIPIWVVLIVSISVDPFSMRTALARIFGF